MKQKWVKPRDEYYVQTGSQFDNPYGVPHDEIMRDVVTQSPEYVAQVIFGKYVEMSGLVFTGDSIKMLIDRQWPRVVGNTFLDRFVADQARAAYGPIFPGTPERGDWGYRFHTGIDWARQTDFTVIHTIDTATMPAKTVYWRRLNRVPWEELYREAGKARYLFGPNILFDGTGPAGDVIADALESRSFCPVHQNTVRVGEMCQRDGEFLSGCGESLYLPLSCAEPYTFSAASKKELVEHLRDVMATGYDARAPDAPYGWLRCPPIEQLEEELSFYAWDDKKLSTDCVFALALAAWSGLEDATGEIVEGSPRGQ